MKLSQIAPQQLNEQDDGPTDAGFSSTQDIKAAVLPHLQNEIDKLNRKAMKNGCPEIHIDVSQPFFKTVKVDGNEVEEKYVTVEVDGEAPAIQGYQFLATIQHKSGGNVIRTMPGVDESNVKNFYDAKPDYCDHCKKKRARIDTFLIRDEQTGDLRQIGRNCLADFLGGKDPKKMLWWFSLKDRVDNVISSVEDYEGRLRQRAEYATSQDRVLDAAAAIVSHYGYLSNAKANYGDDTTSYILRTLMFGVPSTMSDDDKKKYRQWVSIVENAGSKEEKYKEDALNWFNNELTDDEKLNNNFLHNIDVILKSDRVTPRDVGILGALFAAYDRVKNRNKAQASKSNDWIGEPGDKIPKTRVKVTSIRWVENHFQYDGPDKQLVKMEDDAGNSYTWWNNSAKEMEEGVSYDIVGKVKKHEEYRGRKTTTIYYVKVSDV